MAIRIDAAARGQVRLFRQRVHQQSARIRTLSEGPEMSDNVQIWCHKTNARGRERIATRIQRALPGVQWFRLAANVREWTGPVMLGAYLENSCPTLVFPRDPGQAQESVVVRYILLARSGVYSGLWTLEIPIHALGRIAQRLPDVPLADVIFAGHQQALASALSEVKPGAGFWLATPPAGAFFCEMIIGPDESMNGELTTYMRARTWLHNDQLQDNQIPIRAAADGEARLSDGLLLPLPIRELRFNGRDLTFRPRFPR